MTDSVLITGASTGLGLETAIYLARCGFEVYASMRNPDQRAALDEAADREAVKVQVLKLDLTDQESINQAIETIIFQSGSLYGLVNNAGIGLRGYFEDLTEAEIRQVYEVNVLGTMAVTRAVLPHLRAARRGRIAIITSVGGRIASMGLSAYCASKFAQEGFGESLAQEVSPFGIHVSLIEPAIIKTERWSINRGIAKGALNPDSPYYNWFRASEQAADRLVKTSPTMPIHVAQCVHKVLTVPHPRLRYVVGRRANLAITLRRYLPGELFERLYFGFAVRQVASASRAIGNREDGESISYG